MARIAQNPKRRKHFRESAGALLQQRFDALLPPGAPQEGGEGGGVQVDVSPPHKRPVLGPPGEVRDRRREVLYPITCPSCGGTVTWTAIPTAEGWCRQCRRWCPAGAPAHGGHKPNVTGGSKDGR